MCVWYGIFVLQKVEYINTFITFELKLCEGIECHFTVDWFVVNRSEWECSWYRKIPAEWIKKRGNCFIAILTVRFVYCFLPSVAYQVFPLSFPTHSHPRHIKSVKVPSHARKQSLIIQSCTHFSSYYAYALVSNLRTATPFNPSTLSTFNKQLLWLTTYNWLLGLGCTLN